jgi:hypothetical protein
VVIAPDKKLMDSQKVVTPVKTGVQRDFNLLILLDTGFRRYDGKVDFPTFCEFIKICNQNKNLSGVCQETFPQILKRPAPLNPGIGKPPLPRLPDLKGPLDPGKGLLLLEGPGGADKNGGIRVSC